MDFIKVLLDLLANRLPYMLILFGFIAVFASVFPFKMERNGWSIKNPSSKLARLTLGLFGFLTIVGSLFAIYKLDQKFIAKASRKHIASYVSYASISGTEAECLAERCRLTFRDSVVILAPEGQSADYKGRIKTSGKITKFKTIPMYKVLNPEQYPSNPTYVDFEIPVEPSSKQRLEARGEAVIENQQTAANGKIGIHLPYATDYVVFMVDISKMEFNPASPVEAKIETRNTDGTLVSGYINPRVNTFDNGKMFVITANDVAEGSSIILSWNRD